MGDGESRTNHGDGGAVQPALRMVVSWMVRQIARGRKRTKVLKVWVAWDIDLRGERG